MSLHGRCRLVALAAVLAVVGLATLGAGSASAGLSIPFVNWAVSGHLTPKKLGEPVILPKHSTFNGAAEFSAFPPAKGWGATVSGKLAVPPFTANLKLVGLVPTDVHVTFTEVGTSGGTIGEAPEADCPNPTIPGPCAVMNVSSKAIIGMEEVGLLGINVPVSCQTAEPVDFELSTHLTYPELTDLGPHFSGTVTIPNIECGGLEGLVVAPLLTTLMSGPENPYALYIAPREPSEPKSVTLPASSTTQVSALLNGRVDPNGEELTSCEIEYGPTTEYGKSLPCQPEADQIKKIFSDNIVHAQAAELAEGATYHYRLVATNSLGTTAGEDLTVTTLTAAEEPEYGQCVAQKHGKYNAGCATLATKAGKGKAEWIPGPPSSACVKQKKGEYTDSTCTTKSAKAKKGTFEKLPGSGFTSTSGPVVLETAGLSSTVTCSSSSGAGEVTGVSTGTERLTLSGCESGGKKCQSEGAESTPSGTPGVIDTNQLDTRLLGSAKGVQTQLTSGEHVPYFAEFGCEGTHYRVTGALAGVDQGSINLAGTTSTTKFAFEEGEQALLTAAKSGESWGTPHPTIATATLSNTSASPTEIRTP